MLNDRDRLKWAAFNTAGDDEATVGIDNTAQVWLPGALQY